MTSLLAKKLISDSPTLAKELQGIYEAALKIWEEPYMPKFTVHGKAHFEQVARNLDCLTKPLQAGSEPLTSEEIYVLLAACYLHDIGMQQDLPDARQEHAQYAYDLILHSHALIGGLERKITLDIPDTNSRAAIALIARAHWTNYALELKPEEYIRDDNSKGRLRLLGVLLAMADLLDLSPIRAGHFRSPHRLLKLDGLGELHQGMHQIVKGLEIVPADPSVPSDLQFQLTWRQDDEVTHDISDWVLTWFASQWRQLYPELTRLSGGAIRWHDPWVLTKFDVLKGSPVHTFTDSALIQLRADMKEQDRINRDNFVNAIRDGVKEKKRAIFLLQGDSNSDAKELLNWAFHHAQIIDEVKVARLDLRSGDPLGVTTAIASLTEQWGQHLEEMEEEFEAIDLLKDLMRNGLGRMFVTVMSVAPGEAQTLDNLLKTLFDLPEGSGHICIVAGLASRDPQVPEGVHRRSYDLKPFTKREVKKHLKEKLGFGTDRSASLYNRMEQVRGVLEHPTVTYEYTRAHFDFRVG